MYWYINIYVHLFGTFKEVSTRMHGVENFYSTMKYLKI